MIKRYTNYGSICSSKVSHFISNFINRIKSSSSTLLSTLGKLQLHHRNIIDCGIAFIAIILSTIMRMGLGIFEYSLVSLFLNSLVYSLVTGAVFLKLAINKESWEEFSISQIKQLLVGVIITNLLSYSMMIIMDRHGCLSSSIMFINTFVLVVLLLIPRLLSRHRIISQASDIIVGTPDSVSSEFTNVVSTNNFNPIGVVVSGSENGNIKGITTLTGGRIPVLGQLSNISAILQSLQTRKVMPKRLVILNPVASDEFELLKKYTLQNGIIMLQVFTSA